MSDRPLRFGILGCGVIAPSHADAIAILPDAVLAGVADAQAERVQETAKRYRVPGYESLDAMLSGQDLDVVSICTPSGMHREAAVQVMRAGRHAIVEKPLDLTVEGVDEVLRVQQETGRKLAVISQHRFDPAAQQVHDLLAEGAFGDLVMGNAHLLWWRAQSYYDSRSWRGTRALDGGVLLNQAVHSLDLLLWLAGSVSHVFAYTNRRVHQMEMEDVAVAALHFSSGALGTIGATTGAYPGVTARVEILGSRGSAVIQDDRLVFLHSARDAGKEVGPYGIAGLAPPQEEDNGTTTQPLPSAHTLQIADMIRAIREDREPLVTGQEARRPVALIDAIYRSAQTGQQATIS